MKKTIFYWLTTMVLILAIWGAGSLSFKDFSGVLSCPKFIGIPVCYLVFLFFILAGIGHLMSTKTGKIIFFVFIAIPGVLAFFASIAELNMAHTCPQTASGIPMCFISLGLCSTLVVFKYISLKQKNLAIFTNSEVKFK
ncbi:hypothetical protein [Aquimarina agarivorans]|uniref:hypothetical protein n=1 Tax=Aquimarina agarivorans TaxID=980584 RepID=UPI000248F618|nr:hypothetical protein [Aquimarina agarivorans]